MVAAGIYAGTLRDAVRALKYQRLRALAAPLGDLAAAAYGSPEFGTLVVPVPDHPTRTAERGVDHTRLLAVAVAARLGTPVALPGALARTRPTPPQVGLTPLERLANVAGAFLAGPEVAGRDIVLVDDVMTTGATARACAMALLAVGATRVEVCSVARALDDRG